MIRRRTKDVLLQLPERMDKVLYVTMTEHQSEIHEEYRLHVAKLIIKWHRQGFLNEKDRQSLMIFLNTMRMVCDSTFILDQGDNAIFLEDSKFKILMNSVEEMIVPEPSLINQSADYEADETQPDEVNYEVSVSVEEPGNNKILL